MPHVVVFDIETIPDLNGFAAANGHQGKSDDDVRAAMGDKFPKPHLSLNRLYRSVDRSSRWRSLATGTELRALRRLQREQEPGRYVFMSERGAPSGNNLVRRT
jgi:hypothetical protein